MQKHFILTIKIITIITILHFLNINKSIANNNLYSFNSNVDTIGKTVISIPNAFSPNGDGVNDFFKIINLGENELIEFRIFNRWGTTVYKAENNAGWDGNYKNNPQPTGTYGFIIKIEDRSGTQNTYKGTLTLIR